MKNIGLIGCGFVGSALLHTFKNHYNVEVFDIVKEKRTINSIKELTKKCKVIFVAVPTPINENEEFYPNYVYDIYDEISKYNNNNIVVIKSSVQPGTTKFLQEKYKNISTVFNPEFLRENTHLEDFENQKYIILGGDNEALLVVESVYKKVFPNVPVYKTDETTAEMMKFFINTFLATKVSFCNEMYDICEKLDIKYDNVKELVLLDERIGDSHTKVPGEGTKLAPHGRGYGKLCLPLNTTILLDLAKKLNIDTPILNAVKNRNETIDRPEKDWVIDGKTIVRCKKND